MLFVTKENTRRRQNLTISGVTFRLVKMRSIRYCNLKMGHFYSIPQQNIPTCYHILKYPKLILQRRCPLMAMLTVSFRGHFKPWFLSCAGSFVTLPSFNMPLIDLDPQQVKQWTTRVNTAGYLTMANQLSYMMVWLCFYPWRTASVAEGLWRKRVRSHFNLRFLFQLGTVFLLGKV